MNAMAGIDVSVLKQWIVKVTNVVALHHFMCLGFALIAWAIALTPRDGVMGWFTLRTGLRSDWLVVAFMAGAFIFANKPNKRWFMLAMLPLVIYMLIRAWNVLETGELSLTTVYYVAAGVLLPIVLHRRGLGRITITQAYAGSMVLIGMSVLQYPQAGTAKWIYDLYGLRGELIGIIISACGLLLAMYNPPRAIVYLSIPFSLYVLCATYFAFRHLSLVSGFVAAELLVSMVLVTTGWGGAFEEHATKKRAEITAVINGN